jgi:dienelactone hydrolase
VLIAHELFGVNPDIAAITEAFAAEGFVAIAPEFYHRDAEPGRWLERDDGGRLTGGISGRLLYLVGSDDRLIDQAEQEAIGAALSAAGIDDELISYPGVAHAFFWPGTEAFDETARADAWRRLIDFVSEPSPLPPE